MIELNDVNGASNITSMFAQKCLEIFQEPLVGCEMGIAYGGGPERIGKLWKDRGIVYGFDTFEGHPQDEVIDNCDFTQKDGGKDAFVARCMDNWYEMFGTEALTIEYQQSQLDAQGLDNVKLIKGLITPETDVSFIEKLHYCFIDLDYHVCMKDAFDLVDSKITNCGFLLLHDVIPAHHIPGLYDLYNQIVMSGNYKIILESPSSYIVGLQKIKENNLTWI
jgi:hypothetical protein